MTDFHDCLRLSSAPRALLLLAMIASLATPGGAQISREAQRDVATQAASPRLPAEDGAAPTASAGPPPLEVLGLGSEYGEQAILRRRAQVEPWSVSTDALFNYTSNAALTPSGEREDWYLRSGVSIGYTNKVKGPLFFDFALQHYLFRYTEYDGLDFDHTRAETGVLVEFPWLADAFFSARYAYQRIAEPFGSELFEGHSAALGLQKVWKISRGQQVFAGASADLALATDPSASERDEYSAVIGYSARFTQRFSAQASYRIGWYRYAESGREDWNQIVALGLAYEVTDWARVSASASFSRNLSNRSFAEYDNFVSGVGLHLRLAF